MTLFFLYHNHEKKATKIQPELSSWSILQHVAQQFRHYFIKCVHIIFEKIIYNL